MKIVMNVFLQNPTSFIFKDNRKQFSMKHQIKFAIFEHKKSFKIFCMIAKSNKRTAVCKKQTVVQN